MNVSELPKSCIFGWNMGGHWDTAGRETVWVITGSVIHRARSNK